MNTCKDCKYFRRDGALSVTGDCGMVNLSRLDPIDETKRMTYIEADHGGVFYVGEDFGCIHFEQIREK
jgi:hypothetical protein